MKNRGGYLEGCTGEPWAKGQQKSEDDGDIAEEFVWQSKEKNEVIGLSVRL